MDAARHRRWATALVKMALEKAGNAEAIQQWIAKWEPLADKAIDAFVQPCLKCPMLLQMPKAQRAIFDAR